MDDEKLKLENLLDLATALNQQNNFQEILRLVTQQASDLLNADVTLIMMLNPRTEQTVKTVFKGGDGGEDPRFKTVYHQICGWLMKFREPLLSGEIKADDRLKGVDWGDLPI
ncbi:MAG: hypothetical protein GWN00_04085, partial [Aliifodinibius sp.]|nr:hypothetical protein [candidate division Zixibacteria bacterium]NIT55428.1 hypothetical protein [Fodinibius sp.]NIU12889.1 hypothetical protein [candidate division Zixibacteria bacterium]NIV04958.1 hypothetical protein [candidate division Zixibacteria bacterium]NIW40185.1 hypothetical protein [candidate division Zixibacteria bacterium]